MRLIIALMLLPFLLTGQTISSNAIMDFNTADLTTPCNVCTPWRYSRQDSTLRRWDYAQLRWERITTEDQIISRRNDTLFLTNGGFAVLPTGTDISGIQDTLDELWDVVMNGDTNTANVLRVFIPTSAITSRSGDPKAPTDSLMAVIARAYQTAGQARPGSILVSQVAATSSNPSHQAPSLNSSTPFNVWFWDGLRVTRISYGLVAIDIQDTLAGGLNTTVIDPAPDATEASILDFIDNNYESLSMPNGTLLYLKGDGDDVNPDTIWVVLDNVSDATKRVVLLKSKAVNSVTMALPPDFAVVNSNTSGAVLNSASWIAQGESEVLIGPISAPDSVPVFRRLQISDLPASGVTANTYASPSSISVNAKGQVTAITAGTAGITGSGTSGEVAYFTGTSTQTSGPGLRYSTNVLTVGAIGGSGQISFPTTISGFTPSISTSYSSNSFNVGIGSNAIIFNSSGTIVGGATNFILSPNTHTASVAINGTTRLTISGNIATNNTNFINTRVRIGDATAASYILDLGGSTDAVRLALGTTAQRPTLALGTLRYNTTWGGFDVGKTTQRRLVDVDDTNPTSGDVVTHNGTDWGRNAIRAGEVTSGTTDISGDIVVTFGTAMPDASYSATVTLTTGSGFYATVVNRTTTTFTARIFAPGGLAAASVTGVEFTYTLINY